MSKYPQKINLTHSNYGVTTALQSVSRSSKNINCLVSKFFIKREDICSTWDTIKMELDLPDDSIIEVSRKRVSKRLNSAIQYELIEEAKKDVNKLLALTSRKLVTEYLTNEVKGIYSKLSHSDKYVFDSVYYTPKSKRMSLGMSKEVNDKIYTDIDYKVKDILTDDYVFIDVLEVKMITPFLSNSSFNTEFDIALDLRDTIIATHSKVKAERKLLKIKTAVVHPAYNTYLLNKMKDTGESEYNLAFFCYNKLRHDMNPEVIQPSDQLFS